MVIFAFFANGGGSLNINIQEHVMPLAQFSENLRFESAVAVPKNGGVFKKVSRLDASEKCFRTEEIVIHSFFLARPRRARGAGDGPCQVGPGREQLFAQGRLARAGGRRDDDEQR